MANEITSAPYVKRTPVPLNLKPNKVRSEAKIQKRITRILMQLQFRPDQLTHLAAEQDQRSLKPTVNRKLVHVVQRNVHQARQASLDKHTAIYQSPHQRANRTVLTQVDEGAIIFIDVRHTFSTMKAIHEIRSCGCRHLMSRLRPGRYP